MTVQQIELYTHEFLQKLIFMTVRPSQPPALALYSTAIPLVRVTVRYKKPR